MQWEFNAKTQGSRGAKRKAAVLSGKTNHRLRLSNADRNPWLDESARPRRSACRHVAPTMERDKAPAARDIPPAAKSECLASLLLDSSAAPRIRARVAKAGMPGCRTPRWPEPVARERSDRRPVRGPRDCKGWQA